MNSMASVNISIPLTTNITGFLYQSNGDIVMNFQLLDANGGGRSSKHYLLKADGTGVFDLDGGAQISASSPVTLINNLTSAKTNGETALTNAGSAGKITL